MFTGLIEETGTLIKSISKSGKKYFTIKCKVIASEIKIGDSVACNGICLTVIDFDMNSITVEAMNETIAKTTAYIWKINDLINMERAMVLGARLDGHIVQGHVDTVSKVISINTIGDTKYVEISLAEKHYELVVEQGSIALNGISLTIAGLSGKSFKLAIISHTWNNTNLSTLRSGAIVNVEFDVFGKYVQRLLSKRKISKITEESLIEKGF